MGIILIFVLIPAVYGGLLREIYHIGDNPGEKKSAGGVCRWVPLGFAAGLGVFYLLFLLAVRINKGLGFLSKAYILIFAMAACLYILILLLSEIKKAGTLGKPVFQVTASDIADRAKKCSLGIIGYVRRHPLITVFIIIVLWELYNMIAYTEVAYSDDDTYSPMILDMVATGGFFGIDPDTGYESGPGYVPATKYLFTSWLPFQAFGAKLCGVHPLVFTKTILPCALIILHYMIIWELAGAVMGVLGSEEEDHREIIMVIYALLLELGWSSLTTTLSYYFLTWLWYGKAFVQFITVPLFLSEFILMMTEGRRYLRYILLLLVIATASVSASLMGVFLTAAETGVLIIAALLYSKLKKGEAKWH